MKSKIILDGTALTLEKIQKISQGHSIEIHPGAEVHLKKSQQFLEKLSHHQSPIYGVNTGFGYLAKEKIPQKQLLELQDNIIQSHAGGYGEPLSIPETRVAMTLRLNVLLQGYSGASFELCKAMETLYHREIFPVVPEYGSVGASGDLIPLAHLSLPLTGRGMVRYRNKQIPASEALKNAGLKPYRLKGKEGLALINGTQIMLAVGSLALIEARDLLDIADTITALSYEGLAANPSALDPLIHQVRCHQGQQESAKNIRNALKGSYLYDTKTKHPRIQDPYSLRCAPQIHGPSRDAIAKTLQTIETELNATTDNPLIFPEEEKVLSGGNFHGQYLAMAFDFAAIAMAEIGNVSERRLELLVNPHYSHLPPFLTPNPGTHSGYMTLQYLSASMVNENKILANPACTDSIPGNVGIEDHVSMGMTSARKFRKLVKNIRVILAAEVLAAVQAIDLRKAKSLGKKTKIWAKALRKVVPKLTKDRQISLDVEAAVNLLKEGVNG